MPKHLGEQIRAWRDQAGLSQAELAERIGVQLITVSRWERGVSTPYPRNVEAIRAVTQIDAPATAKDRAPIYGLAERVAALEATVARLAEVVLPANGAGSDPRDPVPAKSDSALLHDERVGDRAKRKRQSRGAPRPRGA